MAPANQEPDLSFIVPPASENRWSDLLATMLSTDPRPMSELLGVEFDRVQREAVVAGSGRTSDRLDLLLLRDGREVAAIEVKLLSDLGRRQLDRYVAAFPSTDAYRVLHLARLPVNLRNAAPWTSLTWESVLNAYADSAHDWVRTTAHAWLAQLEALVPAMSAETVWNDVPDDAPGLELALRARIAWLSSQMDLWCELHHDMDPSSGGGNWAVRMWADAAAEDHFVTVELQEGLTAYEWKPIAGRPYRNRLPGPVVLLGLRQDETETSANFAWALLHRLFTTHVLDPSGRPRDDRAWHTTSARPTHPLDKENWQAMVDAGAPRWLGKGWGMKVAQGTGSCLFGARFGLPPTSTLGEIDAELRRLQELVRGMATTEGI